MAIHNLDRIFKPQRIALIGVPNNPKSVGGIVLKNMVGGGFNGVVYPVNPSAESVLGIQCYPDVKSLPRTPDLGVICTPASVVPKMVQDCGEAGVLGLIIISAGFGEAGEKGKVLEKQVKEIKSKFDGMRIIGPNCLGIIVPDSNLNITFALGMPKKGNIAFISQSGALCTSVLDWALEEKIGFSYFVSIGNSIDVGFGDLIDYFGEDETTESIILYIESIREAREFMTAARAFARTKPIVAYKAGRFPESAKVATSHTGAMASEDAVYDAAFQRAGIARVYDIGDIFDCAELIGKHRIPRGSKLGIITNAGGPGVMAIDTLIASNGTLAELSEETMKALNENLPSFWSKGNPVDVLGDARSKRVEKAAKILLGDKGIDAVLVIITPQAMTNPTAIARRIADLSGTTRKPLLAAWLGGQSMQEGIQILNDAGVPTYTTPEDAIMAFMTLVNYSRNLESLYQTPKDIPVKFSLDRGKLRAHFEEIIRNQGSILTEELSKSFLEAYGVPCTKTLTATSAENAIATAEKTGYPVVMKIWSPDITHKTEAGGIALGLESAEEVREAYERIMQKAREYDPEADIKGVTIQPMVYYKNSLELILGIKKDPVFGTAILAGAGGTTAELYKDRALGFPPLNEHLARMMLQQLKIYPLITGYRNRPPLNLEKLLEILMRLSYLAADYPEITELDINPLLVSEEEVIALDARIVIDTELVGKDIKPYSHLALRPYPEEYVHTAELPDGTEVTLRPIKPEDEPMWFELLGSCSKESLYARFRYFFHWKTHEVASRYCFIDYDREVAIVAELNEVGERKLLGVGRMIADPDHDNVEYAILISDKYQNKGLGSIITNYCMEIAREWGLKRIVAQTTSDNKRMVAVFKKLGFDVVIDKKSSLVEVSKELK
ncbi:GNAT family N-acetyltransferase [bacterium]|nr:GNAT family N-acetyltransferase [bacterium]